MLDDGIPIESGLDEPALGDDWHDDGALPVPRARRRTQLQRRRLALRAGIASVEAQLSESARRRDGAVPPGASDVDPSVLTILRGELTQTERALHHLARGHYGLCAVCGQPIDPSRLRLVPAAARCDTCAQATMH